MKGKDQRKLFTEVPATVKSSRTTTDLGKQIWKFQLKILTIGENEQSFCLILRLLLGSIQILGVITAIWLLLTAGVGWLSGSVIAITLFAALLSWLPLSRR